MRKDSLYQRFYPGQFTRPMTEVFADTTESGLIIATPWGSADSVRQVCQTMMDYFSTSLVDREATSPFAKMPGLSGIANQLRGALMLGNDTCLQKYNKDTYTTGFELVMLATHENELCWVQVGQPHVLIIRKNELMPLSNTVDLNLDYNSRAPLPGKLMGVEKQFEFETKSLLLHKGDKIVFLARSRVPSEFFAEDFKKKGKQQIGDRLFNAAVKAGDDQPFWLGILDF